MLCEVEGVVEVEEVAEDREFVVKIERKTDGTELVVLVVVCLRKKE